MCGTKIGKHEERHRMPFPRPSEIPAMMVNNIENPEISLLDANTCEHYWVVFFLSSEQ